VPFAGYVIQGSNGEYPLLEKEEKIQMVRFVKDATANDGKLVIAGSGCECQSCESTKISNPVVGVFFLV